MATFGSSLSFSVTELAPSTRLRSIFTIPNLNLNLNLRCCNNNKNNKNISKKGGPSRFAISPSLPGPRLLGLQASHSDLVSDIQALIEEASTASEPETSPAAKEEEELLPPLVEGSKVYVGNLPWSCNREQLLQLLCQSGTVTLAQKGYVFSGVTNKVIYDKETGRSRGFAFVTMASMEEANAVINKFDGYSFGGRTLRVKFPEKPLGGSSNRGATSVRGAANKLYIGNLPWAVDDARLREIFSQFGNVQEAKVVLDMETGRSRGFGFVSMSSTEEIGKAISSMNGAEIDGRPAKVSYAR